MTNFERLKPHIEAIYKGGITLEEFADIYHDSLQVWDCTMCMIGDPECAHRMGVKTYSECSSEEEWEEGWDNNNGKTCIDVLTEWLREEAEA